MKKSLKLLLSLFIALFVFSACGEEADDAAETAGDQAANQTGGDDKKDETGGDDKKDDTKPADCTPKEDEKKDDEKPKEDEKPKDTSIIGVANEAGTFNTLLAAVKAADLEDALKTGTWTILAPPDDAFNNLDVTPLGLTAVADLLKPENKDLLVKILQYHVVSASAVVKKADVEGLKVATSLANIDLLVEVSDTGDVTIGGAKVTSADVEAKNGVIHVIDKVLVPPGNLKEVMAAADAAATEDGEKYSSLVTIMDEAKYADYLTGTEGYTVLAVKNANVPMDVYESTLKTATDPATGDSLFPANVQVILNRHLIKGKFYSWDLADKTKTFQDLNGNDIEILSLSGGKKLFINSFKVEAKDIVTANGVIHVVSSVFVQ